VYADYAVQGIRYPAYDTARRGGRPSHGAGSLHVPSVLPRRPAQQPSVVPSAPLMQLLTLSALPARAFLIT
jgi:hypothetical protein